MVACQLRAIAYNYSILTVRRARRRVHNLDEAPPPPPPRSFRFHLLRGLPFAAARFELSSSDESKPGAPSGKSGVLASWMYRHFWCCSCAIVEPLPPHYPIDLIYHLSARKRMHHASTHACMRACTHPCAPACAEWQSNEVPAISTLHPAPRKPFNLCL